MRSIFALLLIITACSKNDSDVTIYPPVINEVESKSSINGDWHYYTSGSKGPNGMFFHFEDGYFHAARFYNGLSYGGAPAYIMVRYSGEYVLKDNNIHLTYNLPACMAGQANVYPIEFSTDKTILRIKFSGTNPFQDFKRGTILDHVMTYKPIETGNCNYAKSESSGQRQPAGTNKK